MADFFKIGTITGTHGLNGRLRVYPTTDDITRFERLKSVYVGDKVYSISGVSYNKAFVLLSLQGIDTIEAAEALKRAEIRIDRADALPLGEGEYYAKDLYGIEVVTDLGEELGVLSDIIQTGANDVYAVGNLLLPAIKQCILNVDIEQRKMTVHLLEGLRE
ncbi:ribosome maturation factor RimM [Clostridia bacterium]|nr:ribosome maturation factor RimM [Clostridia bacterium]